MRHTDALLLSPHRVVTLSPHMVKNGGAVASSWLGPFMWQVTAMHPCSGWAPIHSADRWSHGDYDSGYPYENVATSWTTTIDRAITQFLFMGTAAVSAIDWDWREPDKRYLVQTYTISIHSDGNFSGYLLRQTIKNHKNSDGLRCIDWEQSDNNGVDWTSLYHYDIDDDGIVTTSGTAMDGYFGPWLWYYSIVGSEPGEGYVPANALPGWIYHNRNVTWAAESGSATFNNLYIDSSNNIVLTVSFEMTYSLSNDDPWSVDLAREECDAMMATIDLTTASATHPALEGQEGSVPFEIYPYPNYGDSVFMSYLGPYDGVPLHFWWTALPTVGIPDDSITPNVIQKNWMSVEENGQLWNYYKGAIIQIKSLADLPEDVFTKRTIAEVLPVAATNLPATPDPTPLTTDNGSDDLDGSSSDALVTPKFPGELYVYPVPSPWQRIELWHGDV